MQTARRKNILQSKTALIDISYNVMCFFKKFKLTQNNRYGEKVCIWQNYLFWYKHL